MTAVSTTCTWWEHSLAETGMQGMEMHLERDASWDDVVATGRADLQRGLEQLRVVPQRDHTVIDIGCGIGRMSQALAEHYRQVVGLDIAPALLAAANRNNTREHVSFELIENGRLQPRALPQADMVFSYEVLYLLRPPILIGYFEDAFRLLKPEGHFMFQLNVAPIPWRTQISFRLRSVLYRLGVTHWRGWPTAPEVRRYPYERAWVCQQLAAVGFHVVRVAVNDPKQAWFLARKPGQP